MDAVDTGAFTPERRGVGAVPGQIRRQRSIDQPLGGVHRNLCAFFIAEIGDKTQIATGGLAARFEQFLPVVAGTTLGMMLANIPAVLVANRIADKLPVRAIRITAAVMFAALGILSIARGDG